MESGAERDEKCQEKPSRGWKVDPEGRATHAATARSSGRNPLRRRAKATGVSASELRVRTRATYGASGLEDAPSTSLISIFYERGGIDRHMNHMEEINIFKSKKDNIEHFFSILNRPQSEASVLGKLNSR